MLKDVEGGKMDMDGGKKKTKSRDMSSMDLSASIILYDMMNDTNFPKTSNSVFWN